jgi:hypothetical protein
MSKLYAILRHRAVAVIATVALSMVAAVGVVRCSKPSERVGFQNGGFQSGGGGLSSLTVSSPISGTGSSGSPLTSSGDISAVTAGSGMTGGASSGAATLAVNAGSGITADGTSTRVATGSGLTFSSGNVITNAGSGLTYSSGALITNAGSGMTYNAGAFQPNLGAQMTFSGGAIQPNLTGGTCSNGKAATSLSAVGAVTCGDVGKNGANYAGTHFEWATDFVGTTSALSTTSVVDDMFTLSVSAGGLAAPAANSGARPGLIDLTTGASATGRSTLAGSVTAVDFGLGSWTWESVTGVATLSTGVQGYSVIEGFFDALTVDQVDGCYFLYDRENTAAAPTTGAGNSGNLDKWACVCAANSVRTEYVMDGSVTSDGSFTTVNSPVAALTLPNTNIDHLKVVMTTDSLAEFFINGTKRCQITTHIPTGSARVTGWGIQILHNGAGATARTLTADYARAAVDLTSARSP